jgi:hypothetical protein
MEIFLEGLAKLDLATIIVLLGGVYLMNKSNKAEMNSKLDKMQETITDIDRRLCRLEGAFASKDYCMNKDNSQSKKVD